MAFIWVEKHSKGKSEQSETATTGSTAAPLGMITINPVTDRHIPGAFSPTLGALENTATRVVCVKAVVCIVCGFHEEAEDDFVHFHCDMEMKVKTMSYKEIMPVAASVEKKTKATVGDQK